MRWALLALLLVSCDSNKSSTPTPSVDSNTNWLEVCGEAGECPDGTDCVCGVCTQTCDQDMCDSFRPGSTCVQGGSGDRLCDEVETPAAGMCLPACDDDRPCPRGQLCLDGACQPEERRPPRCDERFPCRGGRACVDGRCEPPPPPPPCGDNDACEPGQLCIEDQCVAAPACDREEPEACPDGSECREGLCRPVRPCQSDEMCPPDARCDEGQCVTLGACRTSESCPPGTRCAQGRCERAQRCRFDRECPEQERCIRGTCRPPPPCPWGQSTFCGYALGSDPRELYSCEDGYYELLEVCAELCMGRPGIGDQCATNCPDGPGTYCGDAFDIEPNFLLRCGPDSVVQVAFCRGGCETDAPADARCAQME